jgi:hypothetical protein
MKVFGSLVGCILRDHKTNEVIREELNIYNLNEVIVDYTCKWTQHLLRMNDTFWISVWQPAAET